MDELELVLIKLAGILKEPGAKATTTSNDLAERLHVSQQTASRYLIRLEKEGFITRATKGHKQEIQITEKGLSTLNMLHQTLATFFNIKKGITIDGTIVSGLAEGAYYIKQYEWKILEALGFRPYPGTLNIRVEAGTPDLSEYSSSAIEAFSHGGRQFGALKIIPAELEVRGHKIECHIAVPERTHHKKDLEIISHQNLRTKYGISDGDAAKLSIKRL